MIRYVGIDLHKHLIVGHIVDAAGKTVGTFRYESVDAATLDHIGRKRLQPEDEVVLEATTHCWAVVVVTCGSGEVFKSYWPGMPPGSFGTRGRKPACPIPPFAAFPNDPGGWRSRRAPRVGNVEHSGC